MTMRTLSIKVTYIGGPTALLDVGGVRFLTDPTFDPPGGEYTTGPVTLRKTAGPALDLESLQYDAVLLSHDHHFDNLDRAGRASLAKARRVFTTVEGAARLGGNATGLVPWQSETVDIPSGQVKVTGAPARHGPEGHDRGPVTGFLLQPSGSSESVYVSGDTVWFDGVEQIKAHAKVRYAVLFMGAARVEAVGPWPITMTAEDGVRFAQSFPDATILPVHFEGWQHFSESKNVIQSAFAEAGIAGRLRWMDPGIETEL